LLAQNTLLYAMVDVAVHIPLDV